MRLSTLPPNAQREFRQANSTILWGWKRDVHNEKRLVFFSGELALSGQVLSLDRGFFCYWTVVNSGHAKEIMEKLRSAARRFEHFPGGSELQCRPEGEMARIEFRFGKPTRSDSDLLRRLKLRRPRKRFPKPEFPESRPSVAAEALFPADLYVGSGVSYEAGLPTLCDMHEVFGVDDLDNERFAVGKSDLLPGFLAEEGLERLKQFCRVHEMAIQAGPTPAMMKISELVREGKIRRVFTDNVDNMLAKVDVPFHRVRGSGVFNERFEAEFQSPNLIVVGVAADRRQIIKQARQKGLRIIVVNPCHKVSPNVVHLDYLRTSDLFLRMEARQFFLQELG